MDNMPSVANWMKMTQKGVLDKFQGISGSYSDGEGQRRFVYIEGSRKDKALMVAHADTVWFGTIPQIGYYDGIFFSKRRNEPISFKNKWGNMVKRHGIGIGADDRAGCAIVWALRGLGHSILITSGEEDGCIATKWIMNNKYWREELNRHTFAVEFDRKGKNDCVFYDIATNGFVNYIKENTGYKPQTGTATDIKHICKDICGVNLSVGYYHEHSTEEKLVYDQWLNTLGIAQSWLSQENLPRFELDSKDRFYQYKSCGSQDDYWMGLRDDYSTEYEHSSLQNNTKTNIQETTIRCLNEDCSAEMTQEAWFKNDFKCIKCGSYI